MLKRKLGKTNLEVSVIGLGGIPIQRVDEAHAVEIIKECKKQGINFIDTATGYGVSEKFIGKGLKEAGRENFFIATKSPSYTYDEMKESIKKSLNSLDVEYIDLYQIHNADTEEKYNKSFSENGALKALIEAKKDGLIHHIGITSHSHTILEKALDFEEIETVQFPFNPIESQGIEMFKKAREKNIGVIAMKPVAGGAIRNVALSLKYIINSNIVDVAIPGMESIDQVNENALAGKEITKLTNKENEKIAQEVKELGDEFCRRCGYCLPCPQNINIPFVFNFKAYYERYNLKDWAKERYAAMSAHASDCIKCGACEERCPYKLPIRKMLEDTINIFGE